MQGTVSQFASGRQMRIDEMYTTHFVKFVAVVCCLLISSSCAQKEESEQSTGPRTTEIIRSEERSIAPIIEHNSRALDEPQITDSDVNSEQQSSRNVFLWDIDERNTILEREFVTADYNGDGYLEWDALPSKKTGWIWIEGIRIFVNQDFYDPHFSTAQLEATQRELEGKRNSNRALLNVNKILKQRYDFEFDTADVNGDNELSRDEYHNRNNRIHDKVKRRRLSKLDSNQDGFVDYQEYAVEIEHLREIDENADGFVSSDEQRTHILQRSLHR